MPTNSHWGVMMPLLIHVFMPGQPILQMCLYLHVWLTRTVYMHRIWPYILWLTCQKLCVYTVYIWFWPTLPTFLGHHPYFCAVQTNINFSSTSCCSLLALAFPATVKDFCTILPTFLLVHLVLLPPSFALSCHCCAVFPVTVAVPHKHFSFSTLCRSHQALPSLWLFRTIPPTFLISHLKRSHQALPFPASVARNPPPTFFFFHLDRSHQALPFPASVACIPPPTFFLFHLNRSLQALPFPATVLRSSPQTTFFFSPRSLPPSFSLPCHCCAQFPTNYFSCAGAEQWFPDEFAKAFTWNSGEAASWSAWIEERWAALPWKGWGKMGCTSLEV